MIFFRDKRDVNIHDEPVDPSRHVAIAISDGIGVFSAVSKAFFNDKPVEMNRPKEEPQPKPPESRQETTVRYHFDDWPGTEDVIGLSH